MNHKGPGRKPPIAPPIVGKNVFSPADMTCPPFGAPLAPLGLPGVVRRVKDEMVAAEREPVFVRMSRNLVLTIAVILSQAIAAHCVWQWVLQPRILFGLAFVHWIGISSLTAHARFRSLLDRDGRIDERRAWETVALLPAVIIAVAFVAGRLMGTPFAS